MTKTILLFLFFSQLFFAQESNDKTVYLDSLGSVTPDVEHSYYRIIRDYQLKKAEYRVEDYYLSGKLRKAGLSTNKDYLQENGEFTSFYENGNKESVISYEKGYEKGNCSFWYENGNKKLEGEYLLSGTEKERKVVFRIINYWDVEGKQKTQNGNGEFEDDGSYEGENLNLVSSGRVKDGFKDGIWKGTHSKPDFSFTETYKSGELVSGRSVEKDGTEHNYTETMTKPEPVKGLGDFYKHVRNNFPVPENFSGSGKIITKFVIDKEGNVVEAKTVKGVREDIDLQAIRCVSAYKGFSPAKLRGVKVRCSYQLPITFQSAE